MQRNVLGRALTLVLSSGIALAIGGALMLGATMQDTTPGTLVTSLPECPHHFDSLQLPANYGTFAGSQFSLAGEITNVPEFHDCQALMEDSAGTLKYRGLAAVYASFRLKGLVDSLCRLDSTLNAAAVPPRLERGLTPVAVGRDPQLRSTGVLPVALRSVRLVPRVRPRTCGGPQSLAAPTSAAAAAAALLRDADSAAGPAIAAAEILNFGDSYAPLGIDPAFNCLFLYFDRAGRLRAKMVPVGAKEQDCLTAIPNPDTAKGKRLVLRHTFGSPNPDDYPAVARWDWDSTQREHYIGIMCGASWCEIGDAGFVSSPAYSVPPNLPDWKRVFRIKGWYDEQYLALPVGTGASATLRPSTIKATFFPNPRLDSDQPPKFKDEWLNVAYVRIEGDPGPYTAKLNLRTTPGNVTMNRIDVCHASKWTCLPMTAWFSPSCDPSPPEATSEDKGKWWVRVKNTGGVEYFCLHRRGHESGGLHIVGTTRWRWLWADETGWIRCLNGCCEVDGRNPS